MSDSLHTIPCSPDAEKAVLSALIQWPEQISQRVIEELPAEAFHSGGRRILRDATLELQDGSNPVTPISLTNLLRDRNQLDVVGGPAEIAEIMRFTAGPSDFDYYAKIVQEKATARQIIEVATAAISAAYDPAAESDTLLDNFEKKCLAIRRERSTGNHVLSAEELALEWMEDFESGRRQGKPTGFVDLDAMTGGLRLGNSIIIAGRPGMGKTSFGMNIIENWSIKGKRPAAVFSLEMSKGEVMDRLVASCGRIELDVILKKRAASDGNYARIAQTLARIGQAPLSIDDTPKLTVQQLRAKARRLKKDKGIEIILVDYLQMMGGDESRSNYEKVSQISGELKALAKELEVPIITLAQLSRGPESRHNFRPRMSDLRDSGSIEQDADAVWLLFREAYYAEDDLEREESQGAATLIVSKQRNGGTGDVSLFFNEKITRFESSTK